MRAAAAMNNDTRPSRHRQCSVDPTTQRRRIVHRRHVHRQRVAPRQRAASSTLKVKVGCSRPRGARRRRKAQTVDNVRRAHHLPGRHRYPRPAPVVSPHYCSVLTQARVSILPPSTSPGSNPRSRSSRVSTREVVSVAVSVASAPVGGLVHRRDLTAEVVEAVDAVRQLCRQSNGALLFQRRR